MNASINNTQPLIYRNAIDARLMILSHVRDSLQVADELASLESLAAQIKNCAGQVLIRDSYLKTYVMSTVPKKDLPKYAVLDEFRTVDNFLMNCKAINFDGELYWIEK